MEDEDRVLKGRALSQSKEPYKWAMNGKWEPLKKFYKKSPEEVLGQLTTTNDTVLHVVAVAGCNDVLEFLIGLIKDQLLNALTIENSYGNTTLHEVAASGNLKAAKLLMSLDSHEGLLASRNSLGETPLYRAAAFGRTTMVKYLASKVKRQQDPEQQQDPMEDHFKRTHDTISILQIAVISQHFETALWLVKNYECLANRKEDNGLTTLQLLARMPSAFKPKFQKSIWKMLIYKWICPSTNDLESRINQAPCSENITRWPRLLDMLDEMKNHKFLSRLTRLLVKEDYLWAVDIAQEVNVFKLVYSNKSNDPPPMEKDAQISNDGSHKQTTESTLGKIPLLIATCKGTSKIVKKILDYHPQSVDAIDPVTGQNILHMAIKYRRLDIFQNLEKSKSIMSRLAYKIDKTGNTILHHAADMSFYSVDAQRVSGPAFELQEELRWMARVRKIMPRHYTMHQNNQGLRAKALFDSQHAMLLKSAKQWIKETAQSCSTVAALVATVAYAAAFTAPGGNNDNGVPVLRNSPFFAAFTVSDSVSLICSLTSLGTFLSILTSPFEYENFHRSLPFRLHLGFALLFFSLVGTMLTFTATVVLLIHHQRPWTTSLIYVAALLPVSVFGLSQFPLYDGFRRSVEYFSKKIAEIISPTTTYPEKEKEG